MSKERVKAENKLKHKKKEDIIILETIREIKDRKKINANSGRNSLPFFLHMYLSCSHIHYTCEHLIMSSYVMLKDSVEKLKQQKER